jgi:cellulose synthase (UDP-forming)
MRALVLPGLSALALVCLVAATRQPPPPPPPLLLGVYQTNPTARPETALQLHPFFVAWAQPDLSQQIRHHLQLARQLRRVPLITVEPFPNAEISQHPLLQAVEAGAYDRQLQQLLAPLKAYGGPVLFRFGHEMDLAGQYPWGWSDPSQFKRLYRYVHGYSQRQDARNLIWVWSPAGEPNAAQFWPGSSRVDVIGTSIYSSRAWSPTAQAASFASLMQERRSRLGQFRKPWLISEMGISGNPQEQHQWLSQLQQQLSRFPEVRGLVYFNAPQPASMPLKTGPEDWRLAETTLHHFLQLLRPNSTPAVAS